MTKLEEFFHHGAEAAKHLFDTQGELHPMWLCETDNEELIPIMVEMPENSQRPALADWLRKVFKQRNVVRIVFMAESWCVTMDKKDADNIEEAYSKLKDENGSIRNAPGRIEVVNIIAEDRNGESLTGQFKIKRLESGKGVLSPFEKLDSEKSSGTFSGMLK